MPTTPEDTERWSDQQVARWRETSKPALVINRIASQHPEEVIFQPSRASAECSDYLADNDTRDAEEWSPLTTSRVEWVVIGVAIGVMLAAAAVYLWRVA